MYVRIKASDLKKLLDNEEALKRTTHDFKLTIADLTECRELLRKAEDSLYDMRNMNTNLRSDLNAARAERDSWKKQSDMHADELTKTKTEMLRSAYGENATWFDIAKAIITKELASKHKDDFKKIAQIKRFREVTGCGLKEAKDEIENAYGELGYDFNGISSELKGEKLNS